MESKFGEITFSDSDICNKDDFIPLGEFSPHNVRPWLIHYHGTCIAVVFADSLQDALDEAVDEDKLDAFMIQVSDFGDYGDDGEGITYLGNASEPFDIEGLDFLELPNPAFSFCAMFNARKV